jgi:hypothetical protein
MHLAMFQLSYIYGPVVSSGIIRVCPFPDISYVFSYVIALLDGCVIWLDLAML